ncbi:SpoIIE family protein phosphatase [Streptomyces sp. WI04-05B]|uniref:SpoIIE family protein phosphatase n=1 Tax=Streptomyces TaxID=1883 RepID=UPI0029B5815D|nr:MULTISPECIES: SpoIIE family protein phosphatase [unclassified Streptomyces]MDX2544705.1 SpoIIE family protein phosphatase [Streptomyces sp. WI04-05B]MDX2588769.1 SpoIIE family protein phosphatase [Streptomyces sp. WI04-05A]
MDRQRAGDMGAGKGEGESLGVEAPEDDPGFWRVWPARVRELLGQILDGTPAAIAVLDTELRFRYVNATLARMNGVPAAEHIGRTVAEVVPGVEAREDVLRAVIDDGVPRETISSGHTQADSPLERRYWHGAYHRLRHDGRTLGIVGIVLEISAARQEQRELERARERLALLDEAATRVGTTLDMDTTCQELAEFLVAKLADAATVKVLPEHGTSRAPRDGSLRLRRAALAAVPELEAVMRPLGRPGEYVDHQPSSSVVRCLAAGRPVIDNLMDERDMGRAGAHTGNVSAYLAAGIHSALIVPLTARGHDVGTVTMVRAGESPVFDETDAVIAQDLAGRAAISLDNARRYTTEHDAVVQLQRALLAEPGRPHPDIDVAYRYRPAGRGVLVGGDWFETVALDHGRTLLALGDVMGHGLEAAVAMSRYQAMLRVVAAREPGPDRILLELDHLLHTSGADRPATCLIAIADPRRGICTYASAGHLPPVVFRPDGRATLLPVPPGPPLGTGHSRYVSFTAPCEPGHTLLLYTDGLIERRHEDIDASLRRLTRIRGCPAPEDLLDQVLDQVAPIDPEDDIALVAARYDLAGS